MSEAVPTQEKKRKRKSIEERKEKAKQKDIKKARKKEGIYDKLNSAEDVLSNVVKVGEVKSDLYTLYTLNAKYIFDCVGCTRPKTSHCVAIYKETKELVCNACYGEAIADAKWKSKL